MTPSKFQRSCCHEDANHHPVLRFYNSIHDGELDHTLEQMFSDRETGCQRNEKRFEKTIKTLSRLEAEIEAKKATRAEGWTVRCVLDVDDHHHNAAQEAFA